LLVEEVADLALLEVVVLVVFYTHPLKQSTLDHTQS
tara:strand:+ start:14 stop:121 length:108 start_codon:yes stop_codon:yes gene_type:complete